MVYGCSPDEATGPTGETVLFEPNKVLSMRPNPRTADYPGGGAVRFAQEEFNNTYCLLPAAVLVGGHLQRQPIADEGHVRAIYALKSRAQALMKVPSGNGRTTAGPTFEYVAPEDRV
ncbi:hypothetical protein ACLMAJ_35870 [Nocardia sp. KC 131]|uniref:hypothetical protein n=1 Tax=Nocardia arseniciresistens TaxID=3392119 RepID=UPI00398EA533